MSSRFLLGAAGLAAIILAWAGGEALVRLGHLPLPGPLPGLVTLLAALWCLPRFERLVAPAAGLLLRWFPLFLYPLGAGFLTLSGVGPLVLGKMMLAIAGSLVLSLIVGALVFRALSVER